MELISKEEVLQIAWESVPDEWLKRLEEKIEKLPTYIIDEW